MQEARQAFIKGGGEDKIGLGVGAIRHEYTVGEYVGDLVKAARDNDWSGAMVGSFDVEFSNVPGYDGPGKMVDVTVINDTGWASATKDPVSKTTLRQNVGRDQPGLGGTLWQYYHWREVINAE